MNLFVRIYSFEYFYVRLSLYILSLIIDLQSLIGV